MSRSNKKLTITNNSKARSGRSTKERLPGVVFGDQENSVTDSVLLYRLVFLSRKAVMLSFLLCFCFLLQPFNQARASEEGAGVVLLPTEPQPVMVTEVEPVETEQVVVQEEITSDDQQQVVIPTTPVPSTESPATTTTSVVQLPQPVILPTSTSTASSATQTESPIVTPPPTNYPSQQSDTMQTGGDYDEAEPLSETDATTTSPEPRTLSNQGDIEDFNEPSDGVFISTVSSDSEFAFSKNECTKIDDGSYYCHETKDTITLDDSLLAAPDVDGDLEIFLIKNGERIQITHNLIDDASPHYDEYSQTIVWHRLINDRYQIISYDIKSGVETQLTNTATNNMEPARHGDYTVWQRWIDTNWEIILYDGQKEKRVTDSPRHDIAPNIRGPLVIWNSQSNDGTQALKTYDIQNRTYTTIEDSAGVSVTNPRMVVVYEAVYENGDIVTKGYDLVTGEVVPLSSLPRQVPDNIPESDSTGETRALIQQKPETRELDLDMDDVPEAPTVGTSTPELELPTLDLRPVATSTLEIEAPIISDVEIAIPDLILPPMDTVEDIATSTQSD